MDVVGMTSPPKPFGIIKALGLIFPNSLSQFGFLRSHYKIHWRSPIQIPFTISELYFGSILSFILHKPFLSKAFDGHGLLAILPCVHHYVKL
jgi:hypothetical protein